MTEPSLFVGAGWSTWENAWIAVLVLYELRANRCDIVGG